MKSPSYRRHGAFIIVDESGPPYDRYTVITPSPESDVDDFDMNIPFYPDGTAKGRWVGEAPDFEVEWDF